MNAEIERLRERHDSTTNLATRRTMCLRARRVAAAAGQPVPAWAALRSPGPRPGSASPADRPPAADESTALEALTARYARATPNARHPLRLMARKVAARLGVPHPDWAMPRPPGRRARKPSTPFQPTTSAITPVPEVPAELSAWRQRHEGAIVQLSRAGVTLHPFLAPPMRFPTIEAAVAFVSA